MVVSGSEEEYRNSALNSVTADEQGAFETSVRVSSVDDGRYAILAVGNNRAASMSELSVTIAQSENVTENNAVANTTTADITNETSTETAEEKLIPIVNQTQSSQTNVSTGATVQVDEASGEQGSPLTIHGKGFRSEAPTRILINNIQIRNVITMWKHHLTQ